MPTKQGAPAENCFKSTWARYRTVQRVKEVLPKTPPKRAVIINELANSPSCKNILEEEGSIMTPQIKQKLQMGDHLLSSLKGLSKETKQPMKDPIDKKACMHARRTLRTVVNGTSKKSTGVQRLIEKYTGLRKLPKKKGSSSCMKFQHRKPRRDRITDNVKKAVIDFYVSGEVSRCLPNKKDVSKKDNTAKFVMTVPIKDAYLALKKNHKDVGMKIGFISFYKLKPRNVKTISKTNRRCCLCTVCCNVALKVESVNNFIIGKSKTLKSITKKDAANLTLCAYDEDYPDALCLNQECAKCGQHQLQDHYKEILEKYGGTELTYHRWETILLPAKDGSTKRCMSCVQRKTDFKDFMKEFERDIKASWQMSQLEKCKESMTQNDAVIIMDFAENYTCRFQNEVQSAFWDSNQITIHPMMTYYMVKDADSLKLRKHSVIGVSNDLKHDAHAVLKFREILLKKLEDEIQNLTMINEWTDGCACQYKGKIAFADISNDKHKIQRKFFETSHGKNVCDGLGATVKNVCYQAVISGKKVISTADDLFEYCKEKLTVNTVESKREFIYLDTKYINRERPEVINAETLVGTRKLHSVKNSNKSLELFSRNLSCFCVQCKENLGDCMNLPYVQQWQCKNPKHKSSILSMHII